MKTSAVRELFLLSAILVFLGFPHSGWAQTVSSANLTGQKLAGELKTPDDVARYLWRNFSFEDDQRQFHQNEYWQSPEEFLKNRRGDCEDFAVMAQALLKAMGIKSFLLNVYGSGYAHTLCVFEEGGKYQVIDGDRVRRYKAASLEELSRKIHPFWKSSAVVVPSPATKSGRIVKLFAKSA